MVFFFAGSTSEVVEVESGEFYCPHCTRFPYYRIKQVRRTRTVYGFPLKPTIEADFVECGACGSRFDRRVFAHEPVDATERLRLAAYRSLKCGRSAGTVENELIEGGIGQELAEKIVLDVCGGSFRRCSCGRRYRPQTPYCADCNLALR